MLQLFAFLAIASVAMFFVGVIPNRFSGKPMVTIVFPVISAGFLTTFLLAIFNVLPTNSVNLPWININNTELSFGFASHPQNLLMGLLISVGSVAVMVYSFYYETKNLGRLLAFLSVFTTSMLGLVLSTTLPSVFLFWELIGFCSFWLIGFYLSEQKNARASFSAFYYNRVGDIGLLTSMAIFVYFTKSGEINSVHLEILKQLPIGLQFLFYSGLIIAAFTKSGQMPFHGWLPRAMAGPSPVSAFIHGATLVAAGVWVLAQFRPAFNQTWVLVGLAFTISSVVVSAFLALKQTEIKRLLAYSTISHIGFAFVAVWSVSTNYAVIHLFTHGLAKVAVFLIAGIVLHTFHQSKLAFGSPSVFGKYFYLFVVPIVAIGGIFPTPVFLSKELIIGQFEHTNLIITIALLLSSVLSVGYAAKLFAGLGFINRTNGSKLPSLLAIIPIVTLSVLSLQGFWPSVDILGNYLGISNLHSGGGLFITTSIAFPLLFVGAVIYFNRTPKMLTTYQNLALPSFNFLYMLTGKILINTGNYLAAKPHAFIEKLIKTLSYSVVAFGFVLAYIDKYIIDRLMIFVADTARTSGGFAKDSTTGNLKSFISKAAIGFFLLMVVWLAIVFGL